MTVQWRPELTAMTTPPSFGSKLLSLEMTVDDYAALHSKIREEYTGRMVDILDLSTGT